MECNSWCGASAMHRTSRLAAVGLLRCSCSVAWCRCLGSWNTDRMRPSGRVVPAKDRHVQAGLKQMVGNDVCRSPAATMCRRQMHTHTSICRLEYVSTPHPTPLLAAPELTLHLRARDAQPRALPQQVHARPLARVQARQQVRHRPEVVAGPCCRHQVGSRLASAGTT